MSRIYGREDPSPVRRVRRPEAMVLGEISVFCSVSEQQKPSRNMHLRVGELREQVKCDKS